MVLFVELAPTFTKRDKDIALYHSMGCKLCPLANPPNTFLDMPATGAKHPLIYVLGEGPGREEAYQMRQFVGASGKMLRAIVPPEFEKRIRYNNVVRSRPFNNATPDAIAIECCRPSLVRDIEATRPVAIFGFGNVPLHWAVEMTGITYWRGRKMPVKVGKHTCWYYAFQHPAFFLHSHGGEHKASKEEQMRIWTMDVQRAFAEVEHLPPPVVHGYKEVWQGIETATTFGQEGLALIAQRLEELVDQPDIGVDYETKGLRPYASDAKLLTAAVGNGEQVFAFPFDHPEAEWTPAQRKRLGTLWRNFLWRARGRKWVHNLAFELEWTGYYFGEDLLRRGRWEDTASQACILDERKGKMKPGCFSLEFLVQLYFGFNLKKMMSLPRILLATLPLELVLRYNGGDARYHCLLGLKQEALINAQNLKEAYQLARRRVPTVVLSQLRGIPIDQREVKRLQKKYRARLLTLANVPAHTGKIFALPIIKKFERIKGRPFGPLSNPDVCYIFNDMLKLPQVRIEDKYTHKPRLSADKKILETIDHPLAALLIELREATKRKSTYIDPLDEEFEHTVLFPDGLSHGVFNTIFAETGRLSAEHPNWQNFPKRDAEAKEVRKQIVAPPGCSILAVDYGQIEARVIAMFTKDKTFVQALWENYDVHMEWAERIARAYPRRIGGRKNLTNKDAMKAFRTDIKNQWTFPLFFGAQLSSVAGYLNIPEEYLAEHYDQFWETFAPTLEWQGSLMRFYHKHGYVEGLTGRRRRGPLSPNQVINSPVQGTAAEIVMDGMCRLSETNDPELQPELNIHDDLTYLRVPDERLDEVAEKVITGMLDVPFSWAKVVPIAVEMSVGKNWLDMKDVGTFYSHEWFK